MRGEPIVFDNFDGGVNSVGQPYALDINQARDALNVNTNLIGAIQKRNGFTNVAEPTLPLSSLHGYHGSTHYLVGVGDDGSTTTDIYSITTGGTVTSIKGGATVGVGGIWDAVMAPTQSSEGPLWMMNGTNTPLQWTGTGNVAAWTSSDTIPNGKFLEYHDNRVFVAGVSGAESFLYWSGLGDPRDWDTSIGSSGFTQFDPGDGHGITGLGTVGSYLLVFKDHKTFTVFDTDTGGYRNISDAIGCIAPKSIVQTEKGTFFLSGDDGICVTDGTSIEPLSEPIDNIIETLSDKALATGTYYEESYWLATPSIIIQYDLRTGSWWLHKVFPLSASTGVGVIDFAKIDPSPESDLYAAVTDGTDYFVMEAFADNTFTDNDEAYDTYWTSQWHTLKMPHLRKILRQIRTDGTGIQTLYTASSFSSFDTEQDKVQWEEAIGDTYFGGSGTFGGSGLFGDVTEVAENRYYTPGTGRAWSLKFDASGVGDWTLYSYTLAVDYRRD